MDKTVNAAQLKKMPVGTKVRIHERRGGLHDWQDAKIVWLDARRKALRVHDFFEGVYLRPITDCPGKWFTVEASDDKAG